MKASTRRFALLITLGLTTTGLSSFAQTPGFQHSNMQRVSKIILSPGNASLYSALIDPGNERAYFMTSGSVSSAQFVAVALGSGSTPPAEIGRLTMPYGNYGLLSSGIDTINGYAYVGNASSNPAIISKIALGTGTALPQLVGTLTLNSGETGLVGGDIDIARGYGYFSSGKSIIKISLGAGGAAPTRLGSVCITSVLGAIRRVLVDPTTGFVYAVTTGSPSQVFKINPGSGNSAPTVIGCANFQSGENCCAFATIDPVTGYGYAATYTSPARLVKFALGVGSAQPYRVGACTTGLNYMSIGGVDPVTHFIYVGNDNSFPTSSIMEFYPGTASSPPSLIATIALQPGTVPYTYATRPTPANPVLAGEIYLQSCVIDPAGYAYFGTDTHDGQVVMVQLDR